MALSDYLTLLPNWVGDSDNRLTADDRLNGLALAVARYSQDRPRHITEDILLEGGQVVDLPAEWEPGFSTLERVESPVGQIPPIVLMPGEDWQLLQIPTGLMLALAWPVAAGTEVRLTYTRAHVLSDTEDTIPAHHREPVICWAAAVLCEQLASLYAANSLPSLQADRVDQTSPQKAYVQRAKDLRQRYRDEIGVEEKRNTAAGTVVTPRDRNSLGGLRLTHPLHGWRGQR